MDLATFIASYGYLAVFAGTFIEGETALILGGFFSHRSCITLPGVILAAFAAALASDQVWFHVGRTTGTSRIIGRPALQARAKKIMLLLETHKLLLIVGFRFVYGMRIVAPVMLGATGINPWLFLVLDGASAAVWATGIATLGYFFGQSISLLITQIHPYDTWIFLGVIVLAALLCGIAFLRNRRAK